MSKDNALRLTLTPREPSQVLLEQFSAAALTSAPVSGTPRSRWLSAPIIATVLSGGLLIGGTAYAERSHLTPIIDAVIPQPQAKPTPASTDTTPAAPSLPPTPTVTDEPTDGTAPKPSASVEDHVTAESEPTHDTARATDTQQPSESPSSSDAPSGSSEPTDPTPAPTPDGVSSDN